MSEEVFEPSAMKCRHCGEFSHTREQGYQCMEKEYIDVLSQLTATQQELKEAKEKIELRKSLEDTMLANFNNEVERRNKEITKLTKQNKIMREALVSVEDYGENYSREGREIFRIVSSAITAADAIDKSDDNEERK